MIQSNIKIISVENAKNGEIDSIAYTYSGENGDLIIKIGYQNKNELTCIFDNHVQVIKNDSDNNLINNDENTLFIELNNKVVSVIKEDSLIYLQLVDSHTGDIKKYQILEPKKICVCDNVIALNMGSEILFYNNSGWLIKRYSATQEVDKIVLCDNLAGIIYNDKIELISL